MATTGEQDHLPLSTLNQMDAATRIQGDGFPQGQCPLASGLGAPATELQELSCASDQSDDASQDRDDEQDCLQGHAGEKTIVASMNACGAASVCMRPFGSGLINKLLTDLINLFFRICHQIGVMDPTRIGLFDLAEKRLQWTAQRQSVLAANIANANTPSFQTRDIQSFASVLSSSGSIEPARTQPAHLAGTLPTGLASLTTDPPKARGLDGNTVSLDQQLTKVADTETTQALVTTIWKKYMGMFNTALGRSG